MIDWKFGDWVRHDLRGEGVVVSAGKESVWVAFSCDSGQSPDPVNFASRHAHRWLTPLHPAQPEMSALGVKLDEMMSMLHSLDEGVGFLAERMGPKDHIAGPPVMRDGQLVYTHPTLGEVAVGKPSAFKEPLSPDDAMAMAKFATPMPTPAPHPLAGLEFEPLALKENWTDATLPSVGCWTKQPDYTRFKFRDSTTHAPVPLWQVAKRLGVEHPVPAEVRHTDVEIRKPGAANWWRVASVGRWLQDAEDSDRSNHYRLSSNFHFQPITYDQFREILGRGEKAPLADLSGKRVEFTEPLGYSTGTAPNAVATDNPLYQVGDKVRVTRGVNKGLTAQVYQATWSPRMATGAVRLHRDGVSIGWHDYDEVEFVSRSDT